MLEKSFLSFEDIANEISQQIKEKVVDPWYNYNLLNTDYEDYISDTLFCNDRQLRS